MRVAATPWHTFPAPRAGDRHLREQPRARALLARGRQPNGWCMARPGTERRMESAGAGAPLHLEPGARAALFALRVIWEHLVLPALVSRQGADALPRHGVNVTPALLCVARRGHGARRVFPFRPESRLPRDWQPTGARAGAEALRQAAQIIAVLRLLAAPRSRPGCPAWRLTHSHRLSRRWRTRSYRRAPSRAAPRPAARLPARLAAGTEQEPFPACCAPSHGAPARRAGPADGDRGTPGWDGRGVCGDDRGGAAPRARPLSIDFVSRRRSAGALPGGDRAGVSFPIRVFWLPILECHGIRNAGPSRPTDLHPRDRGLRGGPADRSR